MNTKYDWKSIERDYVRGEMGIRELARMHGIENHSVITPHARIGEWVRKRKEFQAGAIESAIVYMADDEGQRIARDARVTDNIIDAIDEAVTKLRADMKRTEKKLVNNEWIEVPIYTLKPHDIVELIDRLQVVFNRPSAITEERNVGLSLSADGVGLDALRAIVEATRGLGSAGSERSPLPRLDRDREN